MGAVGDRIRNRLLSSLSAADLARLQPDLQPVDLPLRKMLESRGRRIEHVYFLECGIASVVVTAGSHHSLEVGIVGNEGMTGLPVLLATDRSPNETFIQSPGHGFRIATPDLVRAMDQSAAMRKQFLSFAHSLTTQMAFTALSNGRYRIEERLARWLLMAQDRSSSDDVVMTHEFLSMMLGVRRPGVTSALGALEKQGMIAARRGMVSIMDRIALEEAANGSYGAPEAEYERLFGRG